MKEKQIFVLTVAVFFSTHAMAIDITHGKLLSHREWSNGNITGSFSDTVKNQATLNHGLTKNNTLQKRGSDDIEDMYIGTLSQLRFDNGEEIGTTNTPTDIEGTNHTNIENDTDTVQTYVITSTLYICAFLDKPLACDQTGINSISSEDKIELYPQGSVVLDKTVVATKTFPSPGKQYAAIYNDIKMENTRYHFSNESEMKSFNIIEENEK